MKEIPRKSGFDVQEVRREIGLTQQAFAQTFGFTIGALRDWEQGRKKPDRAARVLLAVIRSAPEVVSTAVTKLELGDKSTGRQ